MPNYLMVLMAVSVGGMVVLQAGSNALLGRLLGFLLYTSPSPRDIMSHLVCRLLLEKKNVITISRLYQSHSRNKPSSLNPPVS